MPTRSLQIPVQGMRCATCSSTIEEALLDVEGVEAVQANFATDTASVTYDPSHLQISRLVEAVEDAGYEVSTRTIDLTIMGMHCSSCAATSREALEGVPGVIEADVNFATDDATVKVLEATEAKALHAAIEDAGYEPVRSGGDEEDLTQAREEAVERELTRQRRLVVWGGVLAAPFLFVMVDMFVVPFLPETVLGVSVGWFEFALATLLMGTLGWPFLRGAAKALVRTGTANMDTLVAVGTSAGYVYSTAVLLGALSGGLYFEAVAVILWFITLGNYLEARSKARASGALRKLLELQADEATLVRDGEGVVVDRSEVKVGDVLKVRPGERMPTDGVVVEGQSAVDESMVTGESVPVDKKPGDEVVGSTINENGVLLVEATRVGKDSAIQKIVQRVKDAQARQPAIQRLVDRVSAVFVPLVIVNALVWGSLWFLFPGVLASFVEALPLWGLVGGGPVVGGVPVLEFSVIVFAAALLIACPCALGLATPAATMVGSTLSATNGVLFKGSDVLEKARDVDTVVFDKTGTLTHGEMVLEDVVLVGRGEALGEEGVLGLAAGAESGSEHPLARAIVEGARERGIALEDAEGFESVPGKGVKARVGGRVVLVGNRALLRSEGVDVEGVKGAMEPLEEKGRTAMLVAVDGAVVGIVASGDRVRASARATVDALASRGLRVMMVTGDNVRTARAVAGEVGIGGEDVIAGVLPGEKADVVEELEGEGARVLMVGDGVNDAPALMAAHVGVAIGSGTDVAIESGDVTLMRDDPLDVLKALRVAEGTMAKIRQNLFWAFAYNVTLVPVASLGLLNPALAGMAMAGSSVSVMANSLMFVRYDPGEDYSMLPARVWRRVVPGSRPATG